MHNKDIYVKVVVLLEISFLLYPFIAMVSSVIFRSILEVHFSHAFQYDSVRNKGVLDNILV